MQNSIGLSEIEKKRLENIKQHKEEFTKLFPLDFVKSFSPHSKNGPRKKQAFPEKQLLQVEPRKSLRIACKRSLEMFEDNLNNEISVEDPSCDQRVGIWFSSWTKIQRRQVGGCSNAISSDINTPKRRRIKYTVPSSPGKIEDIALSTSEKIYDAEYGTSCHQCRQKTLDTKTLCRSGQCVGVRGQFCGPCLRNRYGESVKEAILNEEWCCPSCRGICNCSFCMKKRGRRATGILIHLAKEQGYSDVKSFLGD